MLLLIHYKFNHFSLTLFLTLFRQIPFPYLLCFLLQQNITYSMAATGFEGFEKRLELHFTGDDPLLLRMGLRRLELDSLQQVLHAVQCTIVSAVGNSYFDSYVLSESSLFVYPTKIIIKTCGTTQLLKSIRPLIHFASECLGFVLTSCQYSRGSFIFPLSQPFPHTSFDEEVLFLEQTLPPNLSCRKAALMPSKTASHSWHVFCACDESVHRVTSEDDDHVMYTVEVCMTELDMGSAQKFFQPASGGDSGDSSGKKMTAITRINEINPDALICDFGFDPCGYSMNGIDGDRYSTIHVTPENGYSYASFECVGSIYDDEGDITESLKKAVMVFRPGTLSVSITCNDINNEIWTRVARALKPLGLKCRSCAMDEFPAYGNVVYQTFSTCRKKILGF